MAPPPSGAWQATSGWRPRRHLAPCARLELTAAAACVSYLERTQLAQRPVLSPPSREHPAATLLIDPGTRANLELTRTLGGERQGSLIGAIDRTVTPAGARLLGEPLAAPSTDPSAIGDRLDAVEVLVNDPGTRRAVRAALAGTPDFVRSLARLLVGRGGPRDLAAIRIGIAAGVAMAAELDQLKPMPAALAVINRALKGADPKLADTLARALTTCCQHRRERVGSFAPASIPRSMPPASCGTSPAG